MTQITETELEAISGGVTFQEVGEALGRFLDLTIAGFKQLVAGAKDMWASIAEFFR